MRLPANFYVLAITVTIFLAPLCTAKAKQPVFVAPGFRFQDVDTIYILPAVDLRPTEDQAKDQNTEEHRLWVEWAGSYYFQRQGYSTVPEVGKNGRASWIHFRKQREDQAKGNQPAPARLEVAEDDLKEPNESWIRTLGPDGARWVLILALEDSSSHLTFGSASNAIVMGTLFDKQNGKLVWRAIGTGGGGQLGVLGMATKSMMSNLAIETAVTDLSLMVDKRGTKKK